MHIVLAQLCSELDEPFDEEVDRFHSQNDDLTIFEQILISDTVNDDAECSTIGNDLELEDVEIFSVQVALGPTSNEFCGACIDSGAQRTLMGYK